MDNQNNNSQSPYRQRTTDQYKNANAYSDNDPYGRKSAYSEEDGDGGLGVCQFWFQMKVKMQELMSSDIGMQAEKRVVTMDTDPFKIWLAWKMSVRSFSNMLTVPLFTALAYVVYVKAGELFAFLIILLLVLYIMWVLYCPAHQTYTSGAYAIHDNSIALYKAWRIQFRIYQTITIIGLLIGAMFVAGVSYFPDVYNYVLHYTQLALDYVHYPLSLGNVDKGDMQRAAMHITITIGSVVFIYFLFASYLAERAKEEREKYRKQNIINRTNSILAQRKLILKGRS